MRSASCPPLFMVVLAVSAAAATAAADLDPNSNLAEAAINSLFTKWRPTYHFTAPQGWLNVCFFSSDLDELLPCLGQAMLTPR